MIQKVINLYTFEELTPAQQQKAINSIRDSGIIDNSDSYSDAHKTVKAFNNIFGTKEGVDDWLEIRTSHIDDNICELKGLRLRTFILNNFSRELYKGRYYSLWSTKEFPFNKAHGKPYPKLKIRYSKVMFDNSCTLTGDCYDDSILRPIYDIINNYSDRKHSHITFDAIMKDCIQTLRLDLEREDEYINSDEGIKELIENNEYTFTEEGTLETV